MKVQRGSAATLLLLVEALAVLVPSTTAQTTPKFDYDHIQTVICIPDNTVDTVLSYYVGSGEHPFCMHGGRCRDDFAANPEFPCDCPDGWTGPHCEFAPGTEPTDCTRQCYNGGRCQVGLKYPGETLFLTSSSKAGAHAAAPEQPSSSPTDHHLQYCICPEGYYGENCQVEGKRCGQSHCFNGGSCVTIERDDGSLTDHCDCHTAGTDTVAYAGRFCQSPSTSFCARFTHDYLGAGEDLQEQDFCVNGGTCRGNAHEGCDCPEGFTGPVCEFRVIEEAHHATCNLQCQNKGICRKGSKKNLSHLTQFYTNETDGSLTPRQHTEDFEHCVCPVGYVGLTCEFRLDICPGATHACMHGAECVLPTKDDNADPANRLAYTCDCDKADEYGMSFAGKYCQFESTQFCTVDGLRPPEGTGAFCVNDGQCRDFVTHGEPHPGCECPKDMEGTHCEYPVFSNQASRANSPRGGMAISLIVGATLVLVLAVVVIVYRRKQGRERAHRERRSKSKRYQDEVFVEEEEEYSASASYMDRYTDESYLPKPSTMTDSDGMMREEAVPDESLYSYIGTASVDISAGGETDRYTEENRQPAKLPTIDDIDVMIEGMGREESMYSHIGTATSAGDGGGSSNGSFSENPCNGRAMLMKGVIEPRGSRRRRGVE